MVEDKNMELKDVSEKILSIFDAGVPEELPDKIMEAMTGGNVSEYYDKYISMFPNLHEDWLQKVYQFYLADREDKKQDYTPESLALLLAVMTACGEKSVYDACAGSGSLTIRKWSVCPNAEFLCDELDGNVIPLLLFNLAIRNIEAKVRQRDILKGETYEEYHVRRGVKYSAIERTMFSGEKVEKADVAISNPPFNLKGKFQVEGCPVAVDSNYNFVMQCLNMSSKRCGVILPAGILSDAKGSYAREWLFKNKFLKAAILMPENMFESTPVATCILLFDSTKNDDKLLLVDASRSCSQYVREKRGEGDKVHEARIYKKKFNAFTSDQIKAIWEIVEDRIEVRDISMLVDDEALQKHNYSFQIGNYIEPDLDEVTQHRDFNQIISDINRIIKERNVIKVTINKVWAKELGLEGVVEEQKINTDIVASLNGILSSFKNYEVKEKILGNNYIALSNSKVFCIENVDKEHLSSIMHIFMPIYQQHIFYLNEEENRLLAELRDAMLPLLMTGKLAFAE